MTLNPRLALAVTFLFYTAFTAVLHGQNNENTKIPLSESFPPHVTDIDGNHYNTIRIGEQTWIAENLKVTRYRNGDPISNIVLDKEWAEIVNGAYCWYDNDVKYSGNQFGALYNFYAVDDERGLCPDGWHVPTHSEWSILNDLLGGYLKAGGALKEAGTKHWIKANGNNLTGFSALPAGYRNSKGSYVNIFGYAYWWSSTAASDETAWNRNIIYNNQDFSTAPHNKKLGCSVRCIHD